MSAAERERRRVALTGRSRPADVRAKISAGNKGKKRSLETRAKLRDAWARKDRAWITAEFRERSGASMRGKKQSPEHTAKIVAALTGKKASAEACASLRAAWASYTPAERQARVRKALSATNNVRTSIELAVGELLDVLGVDYLAQEFIPGTGYVADFLLPEAGVVIECDGDYWHGRPGAKARDAKRDAVVRGLGFKIVRIPEHAIKAGQALGYLEGVS